MSRSIPAILSALALYMTAHAAPLKAPVYFDAAESATDRAGVTTLTPDDGYDPVRGYGWLQPPTGSFVHPALFSGVRSATLTDGVMGDDYSLRLDLAPGRWTAIAFLDDGWRDAHQVVVRVGEEVLLHKQRVFGLEEEPSDPPINRYRVVQFAIVAKGPVDLRFSLPRTGARLLALHLLPKEWTETESTRWFRRQIDQIGAHDSKVPLDALRAELSQHGRDPSIAAFCTYWKAQLDLLAEAEKWHAARGWDWVSAQTHSSMFTRYKIAVSLLDPLVEHPDGAGFPLRDRARWLRARLLYWIWVEQHLKEDKTAYAADLAELRRQFPGDKLIAMYDGEKIDEPDPFDDYFPPPGTPAWSAAQFEALRRLRDVAHHWIDERQISNGEFGGKTDDDVELLRWWPALMFSGDAKAREGFRKLAEGVWFSPHMHRGYSRTPRDVEHSAEFVADTLPMMALLTRSSVWISRLEWSHRHMRDLWTGRNLQGDLQFKSAWIGASEILLGPPRNRDVSMNARAAKAVRYHAWLTGEAEAYRLLHDWSLTWAAAAARTDKGKPRGLFPASLRWPDAAINGDEPAWHRANMFWHYFDWTADGMLYDQLLFSSLRAGDASLLRPMHDTLALLEKWAAPAGRTGDPEGSRSWAATQLFASREFWGVVAQWRLESGDNRFDHLLRAHGPAYLRYRLTGEAGHLVSGLQRNLLDVLRYNRPMRTSEVLFTDRVFVAQDEGSTGGADLLTAMLTGNQISDSMSPYYHVAWEQAPPTFTALVTSAGSDHVAAEIFLHQPDPAQITARLFRLPPGDYRLTIEAGGRILTERLEKIVDHDHRVKIEAPGETLVMLRVKTVSTVTP